MLGYAGPPPGAVGDGQVRSLADASLAAVHDALSAAEGHPVVALYPAAIPEPYRHAVQVVRSSNEITNVVGVPLDLPPLAGAIASGLIANFAAGRPIDEVVAFVPRIAALLTSVGWLGSVAKLQHVPVSVKLHARSAVPGAAFVAAATGAQRRVVAASRRAPTLPLPVPTPTTQVTVAVGERGDVEPVRRALADAGWSSARAEVREAPLGERYWGTSRHVEVVAHPASATELEQLRLHTALQPCPACRLRSAGPACPFCHHALPVGAPS